MRKEPVLQLTLVEMVWAYLGQMILLAAMDQPSVLRMPELRPQSDTHHQMEPYPIHWFFKASNPWAVSCHIHRRINRKRQITVNRTKLQNKSSVSFCVLARVCVCARKVGNTKLSTFHKKQLKQKNDYKKKRQNFSTNLAA